MYTKAGQGEMEGVGAEGGWEDKKISSFLP